MDEKVAWIFTGQGFNFEQVKKIKAKSFPEDVKKCFKEVFGRSLEAISCLNSDDLIKNEESEINVINQYLPKQKTEDETIAIVDELIKKHNLENLKDMGKLMGFVKKDYPGEVDMGLVGKIAKSKLGN